jgi:uncharacterized protein YggU (UPF0235/DUF167 family)
VPAAADDNDAHADLAVRLTPRADRDRLLRGDPLRARVTAPPVGGAANMALTTLVAKALGVPKSRVSIVRGHTARDKLVRVDGLTAADAQERLSRLRDR